MKLKYKNYIYCCCTAAPAGLKDKNKTEIIDNNKGSVRNDGEVVVVLKKPFFNPKVYFTG